MFQNLKKWLSTKDDLAMYGDILGNGVVDYNITMTWIAAF